MARDTPRRTRIPLLTGNGLTEVRYTGARGGGWRDAYHWLLTIPLWAFFGVMAAGYVAVNAVFALVYATLGGVSGARPGDLLDAFFFSVQVLSTVGFGQVPTQLLTRLVVTLESFTGLFNLAIATGLLFARISRPTARVIFSEQAVVTTYEGEPTLVFRAANQRRNRVVEAEVSLTLLHDVVTKEGDIIRRFDPLATIRSRSPVFILTWQIMHRIDELSPLLGETAESLAARNAVLVVVLRGLDETFAQTIHARGSYTPDKIVWGGRLRDIFLRDDAGRQVIDYTHFHDLE